MAFRPIYSFKRGREYIVGEGTERVAYDYMIKKTKQKEKEEFEGETKLRRDLNGSIADKIMQEWPEEEIQKAVEKEFPSENPARIKTLIKYWQGKKEKMIAEINSLIARLKKGEITQSQANNLFETKCNHYNIFRKTANSYYSSKIEDLGDEER